MLALVLCVNDVSLSIVVCFVCPVTISTSQSHKVIIHSQYTACYLSNDMK